MDGGYDSGYKNCPCFWGRDPGKLVRHLANILPSIAGLNVLDAGCGEGKNSAFLAACGAKIDAFDISDVAIQHAQGLWSPALEINWKVGDVTTQIFDPGKYDVVVAYGLFHCLRGMTFIEDVVNRLQIATRVGGYHAVVALNSRSQDLRAHPDLNPCLLSHEKYLSLYERWQVVVVEDADLREIHPHNNIWHTHSITRLLAKKI